MNQDSSHADDGVVQTGEAVPPGGLVAHPQSGASVRWPDASRSIALGIAGKLPTVGGAVALVLGHFWPSSAPTIMDKIRDEVQELVDASILDAEYAFNNASFTGLKRSMQKYQEAKPPEAGTALDIAIGKADDLFEHLTQSKNAVHMIPLCIALSHVHLALLAERRQHGSVQFAPAGGPPVPYDAAWAVQLTRQRRLYRAYFRDVYPKWLAWRLGKIRSEVDGGHQKTHDALVPGSAVRYEIAHQSPTFLKVAVAATLTRLRNQAVAAMAEVMSPTFVINLYDPTTSAHPPDVDPRFAHVELGPFCAASMGQLAHGPVTTEVKDVGGFVNAIRVRAHETKAADAPSQGQIRAGVSAEGMQLRYPAGQGNYSAGAKAPPSGQDFAVDLAGATHFTGLDVTFNREMMFSVSVHRSDGTVAGPYGTNPLKYHGESKLSAVVPSTYALVGAEYAAGRGAWSQIYGTYVLKLHFAHASVKDVAAPPDGTLLHQPSHAISVVFGGARFHVPDPPTLKALYPGVSVQEVSDDFAGRLPLLPRDGTLLREQSGRVSVIFGGAGFHVPDPQTLIALYDPGAVRNVWNGALTTNAIRRAPADGTLLREAGKIWSVFGGARFHVPDLAVLADLYDANTVGDLWTGALAANQIGLVPRDGTLLRDVSSTTVYEMRQGRKTVVESASARDVVTLWEGALADVP